MKDLIWYIAEFVVAVDLWGEEPHEYRIENYIIKASSADLAHEESIKVSKRLDSSFENEFGEDENHRFIGLHNLSEHFDANNGDIIHVNNTYLTDVSGNPPKARVRDKDELSVFLNCS